MNGKLCSLKTVLAGLVGTMAAAAFGATSDIDTTGYVDLDDYFYFDICFTISDGPGGDPGFPSCTEVFDADGDGDVDLADFSAFQQTRGHLPIPLKDVTGAVLTLGDTAPYSGRATCGDCHDIDQIANGMIGQQGRTDTDRNIIMRDDFYEDGRWWVRGSGMYGRWSGGGGGLNRQTAGKTNAGPSEMDMTAMYWAANCGGCHAGGGGVEFDRDGERLFDVQTGKFGYEELGLSAGNVTLDGDYALIDDADGTLSAAPWNVTGVAGPECLHCHRSDRLWESGADMHREWRASVLGTTTDLVDSQGTSVPAFAAAGTAGQGWFSMLDTETGPPVLQIDYTVGVADGSLVLGAADELYLADKFVTPKPKDRACWGCHLPGGFQGKRGTVWFDERDIHYKKFTNRNDEDPHNDISDDNATACNTCHPGGPDHDFAKGNSPYAQFRNENDWADFRSCRECHLENSPNRHPDAPVVPGEVQVHLIGYEPIEGEGGPFKVLSCQACHVRYALKRANLVTDRSLTGTAVTYLTDEFLSANPIDPTDPDKSTWYPALVKKTDSDGEQRYFPQKMELAIFWADWDRNGTLEDLTDDTIRPIILWRVRTVTGNQPLGAPGDVTDDNGDGKLEVNRPAEILLYINALKQNDRYGIPVALNPVLVKGPKVWYEDASAPGGVASFDVESSGIPVFPYEIFGLDHNVLPKEESWGYAPAFSDGCNDCHRNDTLDSPVMDRRILSDPWDENGQAVYRTVREMTGLITP